jgi:hypothetical protein
MEVLGINEFGLAPRVVDLPVHRRIAMALNVLSELVDAVICS